MKLNIIHLPYRKDRLRALKTELATQGISEYQIWDGIIDQNLPCRGITLAHKKIVQFAKQNRLKEILIAEDDIHFTAPTSFDFYRSNIPFNYDLYLGGIIWGNLKEDNSVNDFSGTTLYMINERFYNTFLSLPENKDLDRVLANLGEYYVCNPMVAIQHNGFSDNRKRFIDFKPYLENTNFYT
jgi:hypothetical protein